MSIFANRVLTVLGQFNGRLSTFVEAVKSTAPDSARLPRKALDGLLQIADRARTGADAICAPSR